MKRSVFERKIRDLEEEGDRLGDQRHNWSSLSFVFVLALVFSFLVFYLLAHLFIYLFIFGGFCIYIFSFFFLIIVKTNELLTFVISEFVAVMKLFRICFLVCRVWVAWLERVLFWFLNCLGIILKNNCLESWGSNIGVLVFLWKSTQAQFTSCFLRRQILQLFIYLFCSVNNLLLSTLHFTGKFFLKKLGDVTLFFSNFIYFNPKWYKIWLSDDKMTKL